MIQKEIRHDRVNDRVNDQSEREREKESEKVRKKESEKETHLKSVWVHSGVSRTETLFRNKIGPLRKRLSKIGMLQGYVLGSNKIR